MTWRPMTDVDAEILAATGQKLRGNDLVTLCNPQGWMSDSLIDYGVTVCPAGEGGFPQAAQSLRSARRPGTGAARCADGAGAGVSAVPGHGRARRETVASALSSVPARAATSGPRRCPQTPL